jgi:hypothetical protein
MAAGTVRIRFEGVSPLEAATLAASLQQHLSDQLRTTAPQVTASLERSDPRSQNLGDIVLLAATSTPGTVREVVSSLPGHVLGGFLAHVVIHAILGWWEKRGRPKIDLESPTGEMVHIDAQTPNPEELLTEKLEGQPPA